MPSPADRYQTRARSLRFRDAAVERDFADHWRNRARLGARLWTLSAALFYGAVTIVLSATLTETVGHWIWLRWAVLAPMIVVPLAEARLGHRWPVLPEALHLFAFAAAAAVSLYLAATVAPPQDYLFLVETALLLALVLCCRHTRLLPALAFVLALGAAQGAILAWADDAVYDPLALTLIAGLAVAGLATAVERERRARASFRDRRLLAEDRTEALGRAEEALAASQAKTRFLAMMSHELRTPLNAIIGFSEAMRMGLFGAIAQPQYRGYLDDIHASGHALLHLINQILDVAKAEEGRIELADGAVEVAPLLEQLQRSFAFSAERAGVSLVCDAGRRVALTADPRLLRGMLDNLVANAIKFTRRGGRVRLSCRRAWSGEIVFAVSDNGVGMTAEETEKALELFGQVQGDLNRKYDGAGIGLPLTRKLVELHGGRLGIVSARGQGTTVTLSFPRERALAGKAPAPGAGGPALDHAA